MMWSTSRFCFSKCVPHPFAVAALFAVELVFVVNGAVERDLADVGAFGYVPAVDDLAHEVVDTFTD